MQGSVSDPRRAEGAHNEDNASANHTRVRMSETPFVAEDDSDRFEPNEEDGSFGNNEEDDESFGNPFRQSDGDRSEPIEEDASGTATTTTKPLQRVDSEVSVSSTTSSETALVIREYDRSTTQLLFLLADY